MLRKPFPLVFPGCVWIGTVEVDSVFQAVALLLERPFPVLAPLSLGVMF